MTSAAFADCHGINRHSASNARAKRTVFMKIAPVSKESVTKEDFNTNEAFKYRPQMNYLRRPVRRNRVACVASRVPTSVAQTRLRIDTSIRSTAQRHKRKKARWPSGHRASCGDRKLRDLAESDFPVSSAVFILRDPRTKPLEFVSAEKPAFP